MKKITNLAKGAIEVFLVVGAALIVGIVGLKILNSDKKVLSIQKNGDLPPYITGDLLDASGRDRKPALIRLHVTTPGEKRRFFCSAFVISNKYAITAAHCLVDEDNILKDEQIEVRDLNNKETGVFAKPGGINIAADLGVILGDFSGFNKLPVATTPVEAMAIASPGVITCGFPRGDSDLCTQFFFRHASEGYFFGRGFITNGMSGGPVIATAIGKVVAVNSAMGSRGVYMAPIIGLFSSLEIEIK